MSIICVSLKRTSGLKREEIMSLIRVILAIGAAFVLWSPNVAAQETLAVGACMADAKSLCGGTAGTGLEPLGGCFRNHVKEVSNACLVSLAKLLEVDAACRAHIKQQCENVQIGEGRLEACLRTAVETLSDSCKDAIVRAVPGAR
jgi:Cysteine rich repeat